MRIPMPFQMAVGAALLLALLAAADSGSQAPLGAATAACQPGVSGHSACVFQAQPRR